MPRWIYNRPPEKCQETELRFAQKLNALLADDWIVRWGYWYHDNVGTLREGDFLVLGPSGGLAVFEVKTSLRYLALLRNGWQSPMAIFGDSSQRPPFRPTDRFDFQSVRARLSQHARLRLGRALSYTRPIHRFLARLGGEGTQDLVAGLQAGEGLPDGPEVQLKEGSAPELPSLVELILDGWESAGLCAPRKVLILYDRSHIGKTALAGLECLGAHELRPFTETLENPRQEAVGHCSIHKAKGLDSLGVILVGLRPFDKLATPYERFTYFMGASRARQLLACVHLRGD